MVHNIIEGYYWARSAFFRFIRYLMGQLSRQREEIGRVQAQQESLEVEVQQLKRRLSQRSEKALDEEMYVGNFLRCARILTARA